MARHAAVKDLGSEWHDLGYQAPTREHTGRKRLGGGVPVFWSIVLLFAVGGAATIGYLAYSRGWAATKDTVKSFAQTTLRAVEETSQDAAMTAKVKTALALSKRVSAFDIHVESRAGHVTLTGQVPSEEVKQLTEVIARDTAGVADVRNSLTVDPLAKANEVKEQLGQRVADLELKTSVQESMAAVPEVNAAQIKVRVDQGVAYLSGTVENRRIREKAELVVWTTDGVKLVVNELQLRSPGQAPESAAQQLARRVEFDLYLTKALDLTRIQIQAYDGAVILNGSVRTQAERLLAERIAFESPGVQKVVNNLQVVAISSN